MSKKTLNLILDLNCHYLIQLKANCNKLFAQVALYTALQLPLSTCETYEKGRGRIEQRCVSLYANRADLPKGWQGIQRLVKVRRWGLRKGKPYDNTSYYVLSKPIDKACVVAKYIRNHWAIENELHWPKDVLLGEDRMRTTNHQTANLIGALNTIALNLIRLAGYKPIKDTFAKFANNVNELNKLLAF